MSKIAYSFKPETGESTGPVIAQESPLEPGEFWLPKYSTYDDPPAASTNEVAVFAYGATVDRDTLVGNGGVWSVQSDYRGQLIYDQSSKASKEITDIGLIPTGWALTAPLVLLADAKVAKIAEINVKFTVLMSTIKTGYLDDEILSWDKQEAEARAYVANNSSPTPFLSALATARGITVAEIANRVIQKADQFIVASGQIIGTRQKYLDQINAALDIPAVSVIVWP